jgi:hypothetical protein
MGVRRFTRARGAQATSKCEESASYRFSANGSASHGRATIGV